ncbi:MAG: vWA domain-containing protein [Polyangia bacterium]
MPALLRFTKLAALFTSCVLSLSAASSEAAPKCPNLHFIIDRSGSMSTSFDGGTRWSAEVAAVNKVVAKYDGKMPIGATIFTSVTTCGPDPIIKPAIGTKASIAAALAAKMPNGSSGLGSAINPTTSLTELKDSTRSNYVIIITDGVPSCSGGSFDTTDSAINDLRAAYLRSPSLTSYVFGFDDGTVNTELGRIADAGGKPFPTNKYYRITTASGFGTALEQTVDEIYTLSGCDGGMTGDTCYEKGCPRPTDYCIRGVCGQNPCAGYTCPRGDYCFTDGASPPTCMSPCPVGCPSGTRCKADSCASDPCGGPCGPGKYCDKTSKSCKSDPACFGVACKGTSKCVAGLCVDDPCDFITCPTGRRCVPWEGYCEVPDQNPVGDMSTAPRDLGAADPGDLAGGGSGGDGGTTMPPAGGGGCATTSPASPSGAALASLALAALALIALRRPRRA